MKVGDEVPKLSMPTARAPRSTLKFSQERKVRSLAKKTLGSMRVGRAMRLPGLVRDAWVGLGAVVPQVQAQAQEVLLTWGGLEEGLA